MNTKKLNIVITDDHPLVTKSLKDIFETFNNIGQVNIANNGNELLIYMKKKSIDLVVLDIKLPDRDGIELASIIKTTYKKTKVIVLSSFVSPEYVNQCYELKVEAYLNKSAPTDEINEGIKQVISGETYYCKEVKDILLNNLITRDKNPKNQNQKECLSSREIEILKLICKQKNYKQIAEILFISENTVRKHRQNIMQKAGCHSTTELYEYAIKRKLISLPQ